MSRSLHQWLEWQESVHLEEMDFNLEKLKSIYAKLKLPKLAKKVVIVGGTNGKGSCVAMLQAIYHKAGYKVGAYTSPHLYSYNERISINSKPANDDVIIRAFEKIESIRGDVPLTYYEFGTLAAFVCFAAEDLDIAILEVGLGGRLDATNIIDCDASILSSFSLDHQKILGNSLDEIAREKAGILRAKQVSFCGHYNPPSSLTEYAESVGANLSIIGQDFDVQKGSNSWIINKLSSEGLSSETLGPVVFPRLSGEHQVRNASCVVQVCYALNDELPVQINHINQGLAGVDLSGRCELVSDVPQLIVDVSHNEGAVIEFEKFLEAQPKRSKCYIVLAILDDKPAEAFFKSLDKYSNYWCFAQVDTPRSLGAEELATRYVNYHSNNKTTPKPSTFFFSVKEAVRSLSGKVQADDRVLILGSFHTVAEALDSSRA